MEGGQLRRGRYDSQHPWQMCIRDRNYGLDSASLRIGFVYGPGRKYECPVNMILRDCILKSEVMWERGMDQKLDYIYLDDCVKAIATIAMADKLPHTEYNVGGGEIVSYSRIVDKVRELYPKVPVSIGRGAVSYTHLDVYKRQDRC